MDARKHLIIIKGKDQTDSVSSFQFHDGKCEVVYTSAPNKTYSFQSSNQMDKQPVLAIEVDGTGFHEAGSKQAERDIKKNSILCLLRCRI